jgi:membrane protein
MTGVFTLLFVVVPNCHVPLRYALWGGAVTALCFQWAKKFFAWFVASSNFELVYGVFAAVPVFLIWLNVLWMIVLSGAVLVRTLSDRRYLKSPLRKTDLALALECLALFYQAQKTGQLIKDADCLALGLGVVQWHQLKQQWQKARWLVETPSGDYVLCRNLAQTRLWDLACLLRIPLSDLDAAMPVAMPGWQGDFTTRRARLSEAALAQYGVPLSQLFEQAPKAGSDTTEIPLQVAG